MVFIARSVVGLWKINQAPVLQKINLPKAQGSISSANQFLNYQITVILTMGISTIGGLLWLLATKWIKKDVNRISAILKQREKELSKKADYNDSNMK